MSVLRHLYRFGGLANRADPVSTGLDGFAVADNVDITAEGKLRKRAGLRQVVAGEFLSLHKVPGGACYVQDTTGISVLGDNETLVRVHDEPCRLPFEWVTFNDVAYYSHGSVAGALRGGEWLPWTWPSPTEPQVTLSSGSLAAGQYSFAVTFLMPDGRETGASALTTMVAPAGGGFVITPPAPPAGWRACIYATAANSTSLQVLGYSSGEPIGLASGPNSLGVELDPALVGASALPDGAYALCRWLGHLCAATYDEARDLSLIWLSHPLAPHLFAPLTNYIAVPGRVTLLHGTPDTLLVGTTDAINAVRMADDGYAMVPLANYGAPPGKAVAAAGANQWFIWTARGLCQFPDFTNLTERRVSVPPGASVNTAVVYDRGEERFIACVQRGGEAFNPFS